MDFKTLIPDFNAVAKTDWAKPHIDTKDKNWLVVAGLVLLMVVFVFLPWQTFSTTAEGMTQSASRLGITTWFGILGLVCALVAAYGVLYKSLQFVFCGAVLAAVMSLIGWLSIVDMTVGGVTMPAEAIKFADQAAEMASAVSSAFGGGKIEASVGHIGAILSLVASLATAVVSFLQIKKANE